MPMKIAVLTFDGFNELDSLMAAAMINRVRHWKAAESGLLYVAPVGQKQEYVDRARQALLQYLPAPAEA
jgi:hypothetical protein